MQFLNSIGTVKRDANRARKQFMYANHDLEHALLEYEFAVGNTNGEQEYQYILNTLNMQHEEMEEHRKELERIHNDRKRSD